MPGLSERSPSASGVVRAQAIDATRGSLLFLIIYGHALAGLEPGALPRSLEWGLGWLVNLGTPGFVLVSGLLLGTFAATRPDMTGILRKYRQRGILLLGFAHLAIAAALYPVMSSASDSFSGFALGRWYVTDSLAVLFIALAPLVPRLRASQRAALGVLLLVAAQLARWAVWPDISALLVVKEVLFGFGGERAALLDTYPVIALAGMFLIGASLGEAHGRAISGGVDAIGALVRRLRALAFRLIALCAGLVLLSMGARAAAPASTFVRDFLYPDRMFTLFPFYLGAFLLVFAVCLARSAESERGGRFERALALLGRRSLAIYLAQYYVFQTSIWLIGRWQSLSLAELGVLLAVGMPVLVAGVEIFSAIKFSESRRWVMRARCA